MNKLQSLRKKSGLSQNQLAKIAGINVRTLQFYEQGLRVFDDAGIDTILKVCLVLKCKIEDILEKEEYIELLNEYFLMINNINF